MSVTLANLTTILSSDFIRDSRTDINNNFDALNTAATESSAGRMEIATFIEVSGETDDERAITPNKLGQFADNNLLRNSGNQTLSGDFLPFISDTFNLGSSALKWKDLFISSGSIFLGDARFSEQDGTVNIDKNLSVQGTLTALSATFLNTEQVQIFDNFVTLNSNVTAGTPTEDAGIEISRGSSTKARIQWNETLDQWEYGLEGNLSAIASENFVSGGVVIPSFITEAWISFTDGNNSTGEFGNPNKPYKTAAAAISDSGINDFTGVARFIVNLNLVPPITGSIGTIKIGLSGDTVTLSGGSSFTTKAINIRSIGDSPNSDNFVGGPYGIGSCGILDTNFVFTNIPTGSTDGLKNTINLDAITFDSSNTVDSDALEPISGDLDRFPVLSFNDSSVIAVASTFTTASSGGVAISLFGNNFVNLPENLTYDNIAIVQNSRGQNLFVTDPLATETLSSKVQGHFIFNDISNVFVPNLGQFSRISNIAGPVFNQDATPKQYVDEAIINPSLSSDTLVNIIGDESRTTFVATSAVITYLLPPALPGLNYSFIKRTSETLTVSAQLGETVGESIFDPTSGGKIENTTSEDFATLKLLSPDTSGWVIISEDGTWVRS